MNRSTDFRMNPPKTEERSVRRESVMCALCVSGVRVQQWVGPLAVSGDNRSCKVKEGPDYCPPPYVL